MTSHGVLLLPILIICVFDGFARCFVSGKGLKVSAVPVR